MKIQQLNRSVVINQIFFFILFNSHFKKKNTQKVGNKYGHKER